MFRALSTASLIALAAPALADDFTAKSRVDTVTIYPGVAEVMRQITLDLPAGLHQITVPGLPQNLPSDGLRVSGPADVQIGAVNLAYDRLPVTPDQTSAEVQAAKAEVERLEEVLRQRNVSIDEIRLRVQAANDQIAFLQGLSKSSAAENLTASTVADIQALAQMVGTETLRMKQEAFAAEQEAQAAQRARVDELEDLEKARQALKALMAPETEGAVLTFTVNAVEAGEITIDISALEQFANWSPVYDVRLTTGENATMDIDRGVVVSQSTGQDWVDVNLILSTARPGGQIGPSGVWAQPRRIISEEELERERNGVVLQDRAFSGAMVRSAPPAEILAEAAAPPFKPTTNFNGAAVTYTYAGRVDIRNGVEDLRLPLDTLQMEAEVWAEATPMSDSIAYRMAEFTNDSKELLLPGRALLFTDGTMMGFSQMPMLAAGAEAEMGFGPLDGLLLTRATPNKSEGDAGVFTSANRLVEEAVITVENVTGQAWDVRLYDAIPYSEQDDLEVSFEARPRVSAEAPDGRRGILQWNLAVDAGEKQTVTLDYTLEWPNGYVLR